MGATGVIVINTDDNLNIYAQAGDDQERPEVPTLIIKKTDGDKLVGDIMSVINVTLIEDGVINTDLYRQSHLYASDVNGIAFTVILKDVVYAPYDAAYGIEEVVDVYKVESLVGTYVANFAPDGVPRTVMTYNKGAHWQYLPSPPGAE